MKLHEEFKLYETMWDSTAETSGRPMFDETELDACLARINANSDYTLDNYISVKLSKDDLKKALKIGTTISHGFNGMTIPAQIVDSANLVFMYDNGAAWVDLMLHGDTREESGLDANEYLGDCLPIINSLEFEQNFDSEKEAFEYFKQEILPKVDEVTHNIIQQAWVEGNFSDYSGITDYAQYYNESLKESGNPHGMAYWAAEHLGEFYKMIKTGMPKSGTAAFNKISRSAYKRMKERWRLTPDEIDDILQKGYGLWKEFFM